MKIAVLGAGAWGTAFAVSLADRHSVTLWSRRLDHCEAMLADHENRAYLPGCRLPASIDIVAELGGAVSGADLVVVATPTAALRPTLMALTGLGPAAVLWLCKGFETGTALFPHQIADATLAPTVARGALSGPGFAAEVARGLPAAITLAAPDAAFAASTARSLHGPRLRVYSSDDLIGVEVGGAVKNVIAIATGVSDGLGFGLSARAALITRGLAEITRLGVRLGGRTETFLGLSGAGDLILTCTGDLSRNRRVGLELARGQALPAILARLGHVAEGVPTAHEVRALARRHSVDMPVTDTVCRLLDGEVSAIQAAEALLRRDPRAEDRTY